VADAMTADVLALRPSDGIEDAIRALSDRGVGGAPVVDEDGAVVGMLEDDDLIVEESRLHLPTVINILGAYIELPSSEKKFHKELKKAVGATVADVMTPDPPMVGLDDTLESVATILHEKKLSRVPVVSGGKLVGIVSRGDIVRDLVENQ
jgi:CBS domain-containing protein